MPEVQRGVARGGQFHASANEPKHDHANNLVCKMARATEMAAIIKASENPSVTPRRILGEVSNTILASETPVVVHGMRSSDSFAQAVRRERQS